MSRMGVGWGDREGTKKHRKLGRWPAPSTVLRRWSSPAAGGRGSVCGNLWTHGGGGVHPNI